MKLFSGRTAHLEMMNRILTESARKRAQQVEELERRLERAEPELHALRNRVKQLEHHNYQLTDAATQRASRIQELGREFETQLAEASGRLIDETRRADGYLSVIGQLEAKFTTASARLIVMKPIGPMGT